MMLVTEIAHVSLLFLYIVSMPFGPYLCVQAILSMNFSGLSDVNLAFRRRVTILLILSLFKVANLIGDIYNQANDRLSQNL